jgi:hypothetical protein
MSVKSKEKTYKLNSWRESIVIISIVVDFIVSSKILGSAKNACRGHTHQLIGLELKRRRKKNVFL